MESSLPSFDEEYFEWIDLLEAVLAARDKFTMVELGAGFGRWLVNAAAALTSYNGLPFRLVGVEAEPTHFQWAEAHLRDNGVDPHRCELVHAAAAPADGKVWFYIGRPADWYGQYVTNRRPRWRQRVKMLLRPHGILHGKQVTRVRAVSVRALLQPLRLVDLIDIDVQGAELKVLSTATGEMSEKVKRVHIGTHSRDIETGLRVLFRRLGWKPLNDYPCNSEADTPWGVIKFQDGVQTWVNPALMVPELTDAPLDSAERRAVRSAT